MTIKQKRAIWYKYQKQAIIKQFNEIHSHGLENEWREFYKTNCFNYVHSKNLLNAFCRLHGLKIYTI